MLGTRLQGRMQATLFPRHKPVPHGQNQTTGRENHSKGKFPSPHRLDSGSICSTSGRTFVKASNSDSYEIPEEEIAGSPAWRNRQRTSTLPSLARTPEQTFVLAGLLKILLLAALWPSALIFKPLGYSPHGFAAYFMLIPFGLALAYLAGLIVKSNLMKRRRSGLLIILLSALLMTAASLLYTYRQPLPNSGSLVVSQQTKEPSWKDEPFQSAAPSPAKDSAPA